MVVERHSLTVSSGDVSFFSGVVCGHPGRSAGTRQKQIAYMTA